MKISLLRTLVAAFALCMAVPGQAAMAGDVGSGGEPGVQQEDAGVEFAYTPNTVEYASISDYVDWGHVGREYINFGIRNYTSDLGIRVQFNDVDGTVSATMRNAETDLEGSVTLDGDNGFWVPAEYIYGDTWFNAYVMYSEEGTLSYTVSVYPSKDMTEPALISSEHQIIYIDGNNFPGISVSEERLSGDVNTDIPFQVTVDAGALIGQSGFQLIFGWTGDYEDKGLFAIKGDGITQEESGNYVYNIPTLQSQTYTFTAIATAECGGRFNVELSSNKGAIISGSTINVVIPINYSQSDIDALKAIAKANPLSTDLQKFIEDEYYKKDFNYDDGYNVGVSWNTENPSRVREFILRDTREDRVDTLDFSALSALERIEISGSRVSKLNLSMLNKLTYLYLYSTDLKWTDVTLPSPLPENFNANGDTYIEATGAVPVDDYNAYAQSGTQIDLSAYANVNGTQSAYQWYKVTREPSYESTPVNMTGSNGKFTLTGTPGEYYYCEVTNPLYGNWRMQTPEIKISRTSNDYSPIDTLALRKLAEDNPQVPQLKEFVDSKGWEHENWDTSSDVISTDWTDVAPYRLTHLSFHNMSGKEISKLDLSAFTELIDFECIYNMNISKLDLSNNTKLEILRLQVQDLTDLNLSNNTELKFLEFRGWKLENLDISNCTKLEILRLENVKVPSLDISRFEQLRELDLNSCTELSAQSLEGMANVEVLSLRYTTQFGDYIQSLPSTLYDLDIVGTDYPLPAASIGANLTSLGLPRSVETFDLADYPKLQNLEISYDSHLKYSGIKNYRSGVNFGSSSMIQLVSSSHPEDPDLFENGDTIDLSSEAVINGVNSQYIWVNAKDRTEETEAVKAVEGKPGVFVLDSKEEKYGEYFCIIWNTQFCRSVEINSWSGWRLETSTFRVNTLTPELFDQRDVQVIADIAAQAGEGTDLWNWWTNDDWMTGESYTWGLQAVWNNETPRRLVEWNLGYGNGYESTVETIDVSALDRLEVLSMMGYQNLKNIILPKETSNLRSLTVDGADRLENLIVSPYTELEHLTVSAYGLTSLDVSNNKKLTSLRLNNTFLESVEITNPEIAAQLEVYGMPNSIEAIDLNDFPALKQLYPNTSIMFSDVLNPRQMEPLDGTYQRGPSVGIVRGQYTPYGATLSFQDEMSIAGVASTVSWYNQDYSTGEDILVGTGSSYTLSNDLQPDSYLQARIENSLFPGWVLSPSTWVYTCDGDANLDRLVNVADVTATVSWILSDIENAIERFGWAEADVNYDNYVDVADVTGIVNIIQGKPVTKASELRDAYQSTVLLELDDKGFLSMTSQVPVAGIQLEFTGATKEIPLLSDAAHLVQASTLNGDTLRTLGYSMDGKTIPAGKTVIMQLPAGVKLLKAVFSDAEANSLKAEGDIVPTGIESIQTADQIEAVLNYPNPFSGSTTFSYVLKEQAQSVAIQIFSTSGALVETIEGLPASVGTNRYTTSVQLPGGIYYYRLLLDGKKVSEANTMMIK